MSKSWPSVSWAECEPQPTAFYESGLLKLNCDKALHYLNWHAVMGFEDTVRMTAQWYGAYYQNPYEILDYTRKQIMDYTRIANQKGLSWAL